MRETLLAYVVEGGLRGNPFGKGSVGVREMAHAHWQVRNAPEGQVGIVDVAAGGEWQR